MKPEYVYTIDPVLPLLLTVAAVGAVAMGAYLFITWKRRHDGL